MRKGTKFEGPFRVIAVILVSVMVLSASGCIGSRSGHETQTQGPVLNQTKLSFHIYSTSTSTCDSLKERIKSTFDTSNISCSSLSQTSISALKEYAGIDSKSIVAIMYNGTLKAVIAGNFGKELKKQSVYDTVEKGIREGGIVLVNGNEQKVLKGNTAFYVATVLVTNIVPSKLHFYMYGEHTCPHCRDMLRWIPKIYGNKSLTFYDLVGSSYNRELFMELYRLIGVTGVPVIGVTYNGTLRAVINSEYNASATPSIVRSAINNDGVLIYIGKWYILYYNRNSSRILINALYKIFVDHKTVNTTEVLKEANAAKSKS